MKWLKWAALVAALLILGAFLGLLSLEVWLNVAYGNENRVENPAQNNSRLFPQPLPDSEQAEALTWIPSSCCVTNQCCRPVDKSELQSLPQDKWMVLATEQILFRSGYSKDGRYWRCACDFIGNEWVVHPKANTRCIFVPFQGS